MKLSAVRCNRCRDIIYSRARHDFHSCSCGATSVDGGPGYERILWIPEIGEPDRIEEVEINATPKELYDDWNKRTDRFGRLPAGFTESDDEPSGSVRPKRKRRTASVHCGKVRNPKVPRRKQSAEDIDSGS